MASIQLPPDDERLLKVFSEKYFLAIWEVKVRQPNNTINLEAVLLNEIINSRELQAIINISISRREFYEEDGETIKNKYLLQLANAGKQVQQKIPQVGNTLLQHFPNEFSTPEKQKENSLKISNNSLTLWYKGDLQGFRKSVLKDLGGDTPAGFGRLRPQTFVEEKDGVRTSATISGFVDLSLFEPYEPARSSNKFKGKENPASILVYNADDDTYTINQQSISVIQSDPRQPRINIDVISEDISPALTNELPEAEIPLSDEEKQTILKNFNKFDQQCIMLRCLQQFLNRESRNKNFENLVYLDVSNTEDLLTANNIIHGSKSFKPFINIPNHFLSALVPKIRLYKTYFLKGGEKFDIEIPIEDSISEQDILKNNIGRGFGYGLESFSWENSSFNEMDRNISANLIMKFSNLDSFSKIRKGRFVGIPEKVQNLEKYLDFRFIELIYQVPSKVNAPKNQKEQQQTFENRFKIKVVVGWEFEDSILKNLGFNISNENLEQLKTAIRANNLVLFLYNKGHDIKFDKEGRVVVTINYQSAQEAMINDERRANILSVSPTLKEYELLEEQINKITKENPDVNPEQFDRLAGEQIKRRKALEPTINYNIYSTFLEKMFDKKIIKLFSISKQNILKLKSMRSPTEQPIVRVNFESEFIRSLESQLLGNGEQNVQQQIKDLSDPQKQPNESSEENSLKSLTNVLIKETQEDFIIPYFYFGDLLDLIVENLNINNIDEPDKIRLMTGPIIYERIKSRSIKDQELLGTQAVDPKQKSVNINSNLADLPISLELFLSWFEKEIMSLNRKKITLKNFLSSILEQFISKALTPSCFGDKFISANAKVDLHIFNSIEKNGVDLLTDIDIKNPKVGAKISLANLSFIDQELIFSNLQNLNVVPYLYMQIFYSDVNYKYEIDEQVNELQGVYHLKMGVDRGLVKQFNFSKDDLTALPVAIYSKQGTLNPQVLRTPYNVQISMVGNTIFKPGSIVYVDPTYALSIPEEKNEISQVIDEIGLGGFYIITNTRNNISVGNFTTDLGCRFVNYGIRK
jgi:hypothetical protein